MSALSGIYDADIIQPVVKIKENVSVFTGGFWHHYNVKFIERIPAGPATIAEMVTLSGATALAANGTIAKRIIAILQLNADELLHLRWEPLDNVEGVLWEQGSTIRLSSSRMISRVDRLTRFYDPYLASTTFFIIGSNKDMNLEVRNPMGYATPTARFMFFGIKYVVDEYKELAKVSDPVKVNAVIRNSTWLPAEGYQGVA